VVELFIGARDGPGGVGRLIANICWITIRILIQHCRLAEAPINVPLDSGHMTANLRASFHQTRANEDCSFANAAYYRELAKRRVHWVLWSRSEVEGREYFEAVSYKVEDALNYRYFIDE
jgi:hypothetical protein